MQRLASHPRTQLWLSFASVVVVINLFFACIAMERVPSADEIQKWSALQPFVIQPSSITGVYQNIDTDSVVFHYSTRLTDPTAFWRELHNQARSSGWVHLAAAAETNSSREYETFQRLAPRGELWFSSAEELRVAYRRDRIVVGYVQSDQQGDPKPVSQASEGRFANRELWPRFMALLSQTTAADNGWCVKRAS